eukprot:CAMPEP_0204355202 /NCGR_PEP_ID=MMETSP0469-20131031/33968_1 /ASSEMBLY_ACC=CAM_ASM_000384 /TAXON_ID=2969 /ORGANISM="Oxyrrhis marina" /LENGTH=82 /DNA_ID=CAMNT_0051342411 /DNA_START=374 /DNA_END=618 /DNA_ORIENTATION=-
MDLGAAGAVYSSGVTEIVPAHVALLETVGILPALDTFSRFRAQGKNLTVPVEAGEGRGLPGNALGAALNAITGGARCTFCHR